MYKNTTNKSTFRTRQMEPGFKLELQFKLSFLKNIYTADQLKCYLYMLYHQRVIPPKLNCSTVLFVNFITKTLGSKCTSSLKLLLLSFFRQSDTDTKAVEPPHKACFHFCTSEVCLTSKRWRFWLDPHKISPVHRGGWGLWLLVPKTWEASDPPPWLWSAELDSIA